MKQTIWTSHCNSGEHLHKSTLFEFLWMQMCLPLIQWQYPLNSNTGTNPADDALSQIVHSALRQWLKMSSRFIKTSQIILTQFKLSLVALQQSLSGAKTAKWGTFELYYIYWAQMFAGLYFITIWLSLGKHAVNKHFFCVFASSLKSKICSRMPKTLADRSKGLFFNSNQQNKEKNIKK